MYIYIYLYTTMIIMITVEFCRKPEPVPRTQVRPIFKLRIYNFGFCVKRILKRRWAFLAHRLIYWRSDFGILTQRFLV